MTDSLSPVAERVEAIFARHTVKLTMGGEPTYVPDEPGGAEWNITALGPTKLGYARALAAALVADTLPHALPVLSPGKFYPGEANARWALQLVWNRDGTPLTPALARPAVSTPLDDAAFDRIQRSITGLLTPAARWLRGVDPLDAAARVAVLPLDHDGERFHSADWALGPTIELLATEGSAGLRLPLNLVPEEASRRALTLEWRADGLHVFIPPLLQRPVLEIIEIIAHAAAGQPIAWEGYLPADEDRRWEKLAIAADPGVLEINLPPCATWREYDRWMHALERAGAVAGLRSFKRSATGEEAGTGGGNHLLFGGPSLDENPLFTHPRWVTSMLRYWQQHPSLAYLFTGSYVGPASQAPRPDECVSALYDLELAYQFLEGLGEGDHRYLISETLRHLHTDSSGNTHRSESSFDKFWNVNFDGGCRGLVEFRAIESLPHARWMSAVALLWRALAAHLLEHPCTTPLASFGDTLHDWYFLPTGLWTDFEEVLGDLARSGLQLPAAVFREILEWRFPVRFEFRDGDAALVIRKAHEGWPLLCEQPLEGGSTSRFVDTSIERLEVIASAAFSTSHEVRVQGRPLPLATLPNGQLGAGLRYRRSALYPSLHPGIPVQMPLQLTIAAGGQAHRFELLPGHRMFTAATPPTGPLPAALAPCRKLQANLLTCDLRIP